MWCLSRSFKFVSYNVLASNSVCLHCKYESLRVRAGPTCSTENYIFYLILFQHLFGVYENAKSNTEYCYF